MAASWEYNYEYVINSIFKRSILQDPMELIGLGILLITGIIGIVLINWLFKNYKETRAVETLIFILGALFLFTGIIFLTVEKISYRSWGSPELGDLMAIIALIFSGFATICALLFTFHTTYPEHINILTIIFGALGIIYVVVLSWAIIQGPPFSNVVDFEITYSPIILLIVYCTLVPNLVIVPIMFFYYAKKVRSRDKPISTRSIWMGMAFLCADIGLINEVAPILPVVFSIPLRSFYISAALIWYICLVMPVWFKRKIGWPD